MSKKIIFTTLTLLGVFSITISFGQNNILREDVKDSLISKIILLDSTYYNVNIFKLLESGAPTSGRVRINQKSSIAEAVKNNISEQSNKKMNGYRLRIFFDNSRTARSRSEAIAGEFSSSHPGIPVYREYTNPYFRVSVGDFRTKSEALYLKKQLELTYPKLFIVQDQINFPPL